MKSLVKVAMGNKMVTAGVVGGLVIAGVATKMLNKQKPIKVTKVENHDDEIEEIYERRNSEMQEILEKVDQLNEAIDKEMEA